MQKPTHKNIELQYGSLENFFNGLDLDIVCFQEVKVNADDVPRSLKHVPGFESFWSFSTAKKGYSGCVTYVRLEHAAHNFADDSEMPGVVLLVTTLLLVQSVSSCMLLHLAHTLLGHRRTRAAMVDT